MIDLEVKLETPVMNRMIRDLNKALALGLQEAAFDVELEVIQKIVDLEAFDTFALLESVYVAVYGASTYEDKSAMAADAYLNNPTKWPAIRAMFGGQLELVPEVTAQTPFEAYVACAARHAKAVENGYVSIYGNWVEARPFMAEAEVAARPIALERVRAEVRRLMSRN